MFKTTIIYESAYVNALKEIAKYFKSGNDTPVEKATIKTSDFEKILKENGIEETIFMEEQNV